LSTKNNKQHEKEKVLDIRMQPKDKRKTFKEARDKKYNHEGAVV